MLILIHPPVAKPAEAPAGVVKLHSLCTGAGISCAVVDANIQGMHYLLDGRTPDRTDKSAVATNRDSAALRNWHTYRNIDRYRRTAKSLNHALLNRGRIHGARVGLTDFRQEGFKPVNSLDLILASEYPELNPFYPYLKTVLLPLLERSKPDVVGLSLIYLSQAVCTFAIAGFIRKFLPGVKIIMGGGLVTSWLKNPNWNNPFTGVVDECIPGCGGPYLLSLFDRPANEAHVLPDYRCLGGERYLSPGWILPYSASTGCYWRRCTFCPETTEKNPYRAVSADRVLADLDLSEGDLIHFLDNAISPLLLSRLCEHPLRRPWYGYARFDDRFLDFDYCIRLRRSGCVLLQLGLESADPDLLIRMNKGIDLAKVPAILKNLHSAGIAVYLYILFGTPGETLASARRTMFFVADHSRYIRFINAAIFNLPSFSPEAENLETKKFYQGDLSLYLDFKNPTGWNRGQVRRFLYDEFRRIPAIANILKQSPFYFSSNHAPFFLDVFHGK